MDEVVDASIASWDYESRDQIGLRRNYLRRVVARAGLRFAPPARFGLVFAEITAFGFFLLAAFPLGVSPGFALIVIARFAFGFRAAFFGFLAPLARLALAKYAVIGPK